MYMPGLAIIVPCYNEQPRLNLEAVDELVGGIGDATLYFVNDGSRDNTIGVLNTMAEKYPGRVYVISYAENEGKARAIAKGIRQVAATNTFSYIGYMDADFSTPVREYIKLYRTILEEKAGFIFGSRIKKLNSGINRKPSRHLIGRTISTIIDLHFKLGIYDTQCGAKIFSVEMLDAAFATPFYCNWLFDVEIFIRLKQKNMLKEGIELPLLGWKDIHGSKLSIKTFPKICRELLTLARKY